MNTPNLVFPPIIVAFVLLISLPFIPEEQHDHRLHTVEMNSVKSTQITVCIVEGDTVAQVAYPHTNMTKHIDYDK